MKEHDKTPEKKLNKLETNNLSEVEFKIQLIRCVHELRGRIGDLSENFNKEMESIKKEMESIKKN